MLDGDRKCEPAEEARSHWDCPWASENRELQKMVARGLDGLSSVET